MFRSGLARFITAYFAELRTPRCVNGTVKMNLSEVLRKWRLMKEFSLRDAAKLMGISAPTLIRFEQGRLPDAGTLAKILNWLMRE